MNVACHRWLGWILVALLAVRPSLDVFSQWKTPSPFALDPAPLVGAALLVLGALWFITLPRLEKTALFREPLFWLLGAWLVLMLPWAALPYFAIENEGGAGMREWVRLLTLVPVAAFGFTLVKRGQLRVLLGVLLAGFAVPALVGLVQILAQTGSVIQGFHRINATFAHPNPFAFYLGVLLLLTFWQWQESAWRWGWGALFLLQLGLLAFTFSLTGAAMFLFSIAIALVQMGPKVRWGLLAAFLVFGGLFFATETGRERLANLPTWEDLDRIEQTGEEVPSHVWRALNWRFLYREWLKQPVLGYGLGSSTRVNPNQNWQQGGIGHEPHNDYLRFLVETGAVGALLWLAFLAGVGWRLLQAHRHCAQPACRRLIWLAFALYGAWLLGSVADNLIIATAYQYALWLVFGAAAGLPFMPPADAPTEANSSARPAA